MRRAGAKSPDKANGRSKNQQAYLSVRDMILGLELPPGSRVREDELQARLRIGRTPLREALQRLAYEGLLQIFPRRLIVVAKFGIEDLRHVYEARSALEPPPRPWRRDILRTRPKTMRPCWKANGWWTTGLSTSRISSRETWRSTGSWRASRATCCCRPISSISSR